VVVPWFGVGDRVGGAVGEVGVPPEGVGDGGVEGKGVGVDEGGAVGAAEGEGVGVDVETIVQVAVAVLELSMIIGLLVKPEPEASPVQPLKVYCIPLIVTVALVTEA